MKVSEILRLLNDDGWYLVATRGSHRQYKNPPSPVGLRFRANQVPIWHRARSTVS